MRHRNLTQTQNRQMTKGVAYCKRYVYTLTVINRACFWFSPMLNTWNSQRSDQQAHSAYSSFNPSLLNMQPHQKMSPINRTVVHVTARVMRQDKSYSFSHFCNKAIDSWMNHPHGFLKTFFERSSYSHYFPYAFHRTANLLWRLVESI